MYRFVLHICRVLVAAMVMPALAQTSSSTEPSIEEQRVMATEDEYVAAEVNRDEAALRRLVDDRFVFNRSDGTISGKEELIRDVLEMRMTGQTIRDRSLLIEGDTALVFGTAELKIADAEAKESVTALRYTATYVRRDGSWRMLALQMQPLKQTH